MPKPKPKYLLPVRVPVWLIADMLKWEKTGKLTLPKFARSAFTFDILEDAEVELVRFEFDTQAVIFYFRHPSFEGNPDLCWDDGWLPARVPAVDYVEVSVREKAVGSSLADLAS